MVTMQFVKAVSVTFTPLVGAADANDVLADTQEIPNAIRQGGGRGWLTGLTVIDKDNQTAADMEVWILNANTSIGTEGAAVTLSDADAVANLVAVVEIDSTDWIAGAQFRFVSLGLGDAGLPKPLSAASGQTSLFAAIVTRGTPTQTANGIVATFYFSDAS